MKKVVFMVILLFCLSFVVKANDNKNNGNKKKQILGQNSLLKEAGELADAKKLNFEAYEAWFSRRVFNNYEILFNHCDLGFTLQEPVEEEYKILVKLNNDWKECVVRYNKLAKEVSLRDFRQKKDWRATPLLDYYGLKASEKLIDAIKNKFIETEKSFGHDIMSGYYDFDWQNFSADNRPEPNDFAEAKSIFLQKLLFTYNPPEPAPAEAKRDYGQLAELNNKWKNCVDVYNELVEKSKVKGFLAKKDWQSIPSFDYYIKTFKPPETQDLSVVHILKILKTIGKIIGLAVVSVIVVLFVFVLIKHENGPHGYYPNDPDSSIFN